MKNAGGLFSFVLKEKSIEAIETFCNSLKHFFLAVSWGGHESLVIPAVVGIKKEDFDPENFGHRVIRLYVGLEEPDYLIADLTQALDRVG